MTNLNVLCIGDVVGRPGRTFLRNYLEEIQKEHDIHFTIANGENAAAGLGLTEKTYFELLEYNIDVLTSGNHIYHNKSILPKFNSYKRLVRPLNFPKGNPGTGYTIIKKNNLSIAVVNLIGRVFVGNYDCPFQAIDTHLENIQKEAKIIIVDIHAETTSEKQAMGWFLDGCASLVFGTHTHVMTADNKIMENGTGYISDVGMVGAYESILGMKKEPIVKKFITQMPTKFEPPKNTSVVFNAIKCSIDSLTGKASDIKRINLIY